VPNYQQPDYRNPTVNPNVGNSPVPSGDKIGTGVVPVPNYVEPGLDDKIDPHHTWRGVKS
jgi:hypothetical protein